MLNLGTNISIFRQKVTYLKQLEFTLATFTDVHDTILHYVVEKK